MAGIKVEIDETAFIMLRKLREQFPKLRAQILGYVGHEGKKRLKKQFLSGQEIDLSAYPEDRAMRRTVGYALGRGAEYVRISSYPMNLFERGRRLRSGSRESGKYVVTRKFKSVIMADLQGIVSEFDVKFLKRELARFDQS